MKYFEFKFMETVNGQVANQGDALYYTSDKLNTEEMKRFARKILKKPAAVISIVLTTEIDRETFISKGGNPNVY